MADQKSNLPLLLFLSEKNTGKAYAQSLNTFLLLKSIVLLCISLGMNKSILGAFAYTCQSLPSVEVLQTFFLRCLIFHDFFNNQDFVTLKLRIKGHVLVSLPLLFHAFPCSTPVGTC